MLRRSQAKHNCLPSPHSRVSIQLMPHLSRRLQQQRFWVEVLPWAEIPIPCVKQPTQAHCGNNHPIGWYHCRSTHPQQLYTVHDRQHDFRRLAEENKLHWGQRSSNPSNNLSQNGLSSQVPKHFKIVPLASKITSWLISLLLWLPVKQQLVEAHTRMMLGCGIATSNTATALDLGAITSLTECPNSTKLKSYEPSEIFTTGWWFPGKKHSLKYHQRCSCGFQENRQEDPHKDAAERNVSQLLQQQLRSYKKDNPKERHKKALPACVLCLILSSKSKELLCMMGELVAAAHFWAMRSCKYFKVTCCIFIWWWGTTGGKNDQGSNPLRRRLDRWEHDESLHDICFSGGVVSHHDCRFQNSTAYGCRPGAQTQSNKSVII